MIAGSSLLTDFLEALSNTMYCFVTPSEGYKASQVSCNIYETI